MTEVISSISAREILGGSGRPTLEVALTTNGGSRVTASVPSGTSRGRHEAFELFDGGERYGGFGVRKAVGNVNRLIAPRLLGLPVMDQERLDRILLDLDGTEDKSHLGANAVLPVSVACAKAGALSQGMGCYRYLGGEAARLLPAPIATVLAGGRHSPSDLLFEDYLYIMHGFDRFSEALEALVATRLELGRSLVRYFGPVSDIGGALAPPFGNTPTAFDFMLKASETCGHGAGIFLGLDAAATEFYQAGQNFYTVGEERLSPEELKQLYLGLKRSYPLVFLEDPFEEDDFGSHAALQAELRDCLVVGDDLFASNPGRLRRGVQEKSAGGILLKINQIGTVTEAMEAANIAKKAGMKVIVSLRSNETNDDFIADLAVALGAEQIKLGSPLRGERNAKYNRLLEIEEELGPNARFAGNAS